MSKKFLSPKYKTHEEFLIKILHELFSSPVAPYLAFKGGTLAYFAYNLDRYSTDIDLDLLDHTYEQEVMDIITVLLSRISEIKLYTRGKDLHRRIFRYDSQSTNIKIELNKRDLSHNKYEIKTIQGVDIQCMDCTTMVSNKLLALGERRYNRDLYDTHFFRMQGYEYDDKIITARSDNNVQTLISFIIDQIPHRFTSSSILADGLGDVLTNLQKSRVKQSLAHETIKLLQLYQDTYISSGSVCS